MKQPYFFRRVHKEWVLIGAVVIVVAIAAVTVVGSLLRPQAFVRLGDGVFRAQLARTDAERARGLSGTSSLGDGQAMLFVFDRSDLWGIWMKDMKYPIDVVWLNEQKQVVYSVSNMQPDSYPETFLPQKPARYVIELPAGTIQQKAIGTASVAQFTLPGNK